MNIKAGFDYSVGRDRCWRPHEPRVRAHLRRHDPPRIRYRGIVGDTLTGDDAYAIGRAFGSEIVRTGGHTVCVGYDGRLSSPEMEQAVVDGLKDCGVEAIRVGLGPTPMLYFAVNVLSAAGGSWCPDRIIRRIITVLR